MLVISEHDEGIVKGGAPNDCAPFYAAKNQGLALTMLCENLVRVAAADGS